jgi:lysophospholipase L1-like esterase
VSLLRSRLVARLRPGIAATLAMVEPYREAWERSNAADRDRGGPIWLVLGDSTAQGVGAHAFDRGYVGQLRRQLDARDEQRYGQRWRVANASVSGARLRDVMQQLRWFDELPAAPALVTCAAGSNDLAWRIGLRGIKRDLAQLLAALPNGAVVATMPRGLGERRSEALNAMIRRDAPTRGLVIADVWAHTGAPWRGKLADDGFHPSELGYRDWAAAFAAALELPAAAEPDTRDTR